VPYRTYDSNSGIIVVTASDVGSLVSFFFFFFEFWVVAMNHVSQVRLQYKSGLTWEPRWFELTNNMTVRWINEGDKKSGSFEASEIVSITDSSACYNALVKGCGFVMEISSGKSFLLCAASVAQKQEFVDLLMRAKNGEVLQPRLERASGVAPTLQRGKSDGAIERKSLRNSQAADTTPKSPTLRSSQANSKSPTFSRLSESKSPSLGRNPSPLRKSQGDVTAESLLVAWCAEMEAAIEKLSDAAGNEQDIKEREARIKLLKSDSRGSVLLEQCRSATTNAKFELVLSKLAQAERGVNRMLTTIERDKVLLVKTTEREKSLQASKAVLEENKHIRQALNDAENAFRDWVAQQNNFLDQLSDAPDSRKFQLEDLQKRASKIGEIKEG
jgi:hypothetical protein